MYRILGIMLITFNFSLMALPVDMNGSFHADSTYISKFRGTDQNLGTAGGGSQEIPSTGQDSALFQNYLFRLNPEIIVNDSVTIKGELTNGALRGGFLGDDSIRANSAPLKALYINNSAGNNNVTLNQAYAEIYADTALFKVGRFAKHWGLGAVLNGGTKATDRFFTVLDGAEATLEFQKFSFTPYWARISAGNTQTANDDVREMGLSIVYEDKDQDLKTGILISQRKVEGNSNYLGAATTAKIKLYDFYIEKKWEKTELALEVPILTGTYGTNDIKSFAGILNTKFNFNKRWSLSGLFSYVKGQDDSNDVTLMSLHPNFQVAHLLFRYNYFGVEDNSISIYDRSISNAFIAKIAAEYTRGNWAFELAAIFAKANQAAEVGKTSYNHSTGSIFTASANQDKDLGYELDMTTTYKWYPNVNVTAKVGYLFLGDYYAFTDTATKLDLKNPWTVSLGLSIDF